MYFFDKKTRYLVWNMQEGQARGVGTIKFLVVDEICRIEINITGCGKVQGTYPIYLLSGGIKSLLGELVLNKGRGNYYLKSNTDSLGHKMFSYRQVTGLHIDLKTEGILEQKWLPLLEESTKKNVESKTQKPETLVPEKQAQFVEENKVQPMQEEQRQEMTSGFAQQEKIASQVLHPVDAPIKKAPDEVKPPEKNTMELYPSKWQQLCAIYPVVHPFQDGRAYLSIEPRDFVVLQERYQPMVQNSFLLHGFYHYRHLLLGRMKQGKSIQYYLGVPGVFYEKEKAAALFYGFESFEGAETPSKEGSFGYYMKRVQI